MIRAITVATARTRSTANAAPLSHFTRGLTTCATTSGPQSRSEGLHRRPGSVTPSLGGRLGAVSGVLGGPQLGARAARAAIIPTALARHTGPTIHPSSEIGRAHV